MKIFTLTDTIGWSLRRKALVALGLAGLTRTGGESPASLLAGDHWLFLMFDEIAVKPYTTDTIFVCSGWGKSGKLSSVATYAISTNEWHDAPDLPKPRCDHGIAFVDGRVFVIGGWTPDDGTTDTCVTFSISRNKWEVIPPMSIARSYPGVAVVGDRIFVMGGWHKQIRTCIVEVYKVSGNTWTAPGVVAPMPTPRFEFGVAVIGNRIFTIGGFNDGALSTVAVHDTETNTWTKLSPMPTACYGMAVAVIGHQIWCFGGYSRKNVDVIEVFDVDKNEWTTSKFKMTSPRNGAKAVVIDGMIWIVGGESGGKALDLVEILDPETGTWTNAPSMHSPRYNHAAIAF